MRTVLAHIACLTFIINRNTISPGKAWPFKKSSAHLLPGEDALLLVQKRRVESTAALSHFIGPKPHPRPELAMCAAQQKLHER